MTADLFLTNVAFYVFGAIALIGALIAVAQQNILRAALGLIVSFLGVAGIYFVLEAEFIGIVQILVYVGAIAILILFSVMLTRGLMTERGERAQFPVDWRGVRRLALVRRAGIHRARHQVECRRAKNHRRSDSQNRHRVDDDVLVAV